MVIFIWSRKSNKIEVEKLKANYPTAKIGIPGPGKTGDVNLLAYTINLFK